MSGLISLAVFLVIATLGQAGSDAKRAAEIEREAAERKQDVKPEQRMELIYPIEWTFTSTKCSYSKGCERTQFYVPRER